ncbi:glycosyltransferase family 2 protein [Loktanella agnita]|uniref:glycosyltransferase family 2 protein n=1 Tax=Loktanella agnita TaxID=287097 RepID=UPI00398A1F1F
MKVGLLSCVRDEGPFLLEWVAYHLLRGFDPIVVYSNDSSDGTTELLDTLDRAGVLTHVLQQLAPSQAPQFVAADIAFDHPELQAADWLIWLDVDEFLYCTHWNNDVRDMAENMSEIADVVCINWLNFGSGGVEKWSPGLVIEQFLHRGPENSSRNIMYKSLFKRSNKVRGFGLHRPFMKSDFRESGGRIVNTSFKPMHDEAYRWTSRARHKQGDAPMELVSHENAAIFHYPVKSRESFEGKRRRGQGTKALDSDDRAIRFRERYWMIYNQNAVSDSRMLECVEPVTQKMNELLKLPEVAAAHAACLEGYAKLLNPET